MTKRQSNAPVKFSLAELADLTECPARTIRFYIAKGLLPAPFKAGRGASYGEAHILRIREIRDWQAKGLTLTEVAHKLAGEQPPVMESPTAWWSYQLQPDVIVQVRADASPWRLRQIQRTLKDVASQLGQPNTEKDTNENKQ